MKKTFTLILMLAALISKAQTWSSGTPTFIDFRDVYFHDKNLGFAVGAYFTVVKTTDGGATGNAVSTPLTGNGYLYDIDFSDANHGWSVGDNNNIIRTIDGGNNWTQQNASSMAVFTGCTFVSSSTGWICGTGGTILHTSDSGNTWATQSTPIFYTINEIRSVNASTCMAVADNGYFLRTTDGGTTWDTTTYGTNNLVDLFMVNANVGYMVGYNGVIYKTTNGGANWTALTSGTTSSLLSVSFITANIGWVCSINGEIFFTSDGGATWTQQTTGTTTTLTSLFFDSAAKGWAVGNGGTVVTYTACQSYTATATLSGNNISAGNASSYQWLMNGSVIQGATTQSLSPLSSGNYSVITMSSEGCTDTSATVNYTAPSGITELTKFNIGLSPNPTNELLTIETSSINCTAKIIGMDGRIYFTQMLASNKSTLNVSTLTNGIYFIEISSGENIARQKFIKQ